MYRGRGKEGERYNEKGQDKKEFRALDVRKEQDVLSAGFSGLGDMYDCVWEAGFSGLVDHLQ